MEFTLKVPRHVYLSEVGYYLITINAYGEVCLYGEELAEYQKDFETIREFEAPLIAQGVLDIQVTELHEDVNMPDITFVEPEPSAYLVKFNVDSTEKPYHLLHPLYTKWDERMKNDSRITHRGPATFLD